jgi:hypothetical protein
MHRFHTIHSNNNNAVKMMTKLENDVITFADAIMMHLACLGNTSAAAAAAASAAAVFAATTTNTATTGIQGGFDHNQCSIAVSQSIQNRDDKYV